GPPGFPALFLKLSQEDQRMAIQYVSHADETERRARIQRVQNSIVEAPGVQDVMLRISHDLNKDKGHVFNYNFQQNQKSVLARLGKAPAVSLPDPVIESGYESEKSVGQGSSSNLLVQGATVFSVGIAPPVSTGNQGSKKRNRNRPPAWVRRTRTNVNSTSLSENKVLESSQDSMGKRKASSSTLMSNDEKLGGAIRAESTFWDFRNFATNWIEKIVEKGWNATLPDGNTSLTDRINSCRSALARWKKTQNMNSQSNIERLTKLAPADDIVKCNIAASWSDTSRKSGASWIVRNSRGKVLRHGRRSFSFVQSRELAELLAIFWAIESMNSMRKDEIIFESSCERARACFLYPSSCSGAVEIVGNICDLVQRFQHWSLDHVLETRNVLAQRIVTSVTVDHRYQSYIASGGPNWLKELITYEARNVAPL
ncbi:hypothetical protein HID58_065501, partial [Brassica napus]